LLVVAVATSAAEERERVRLWGSLKPGPEAIGFRVLGARDGSRRLSATATARPIQISLWYPAETTRLYG
jgi:hypothetical protein